MKTNVEMVFDEQLSTGECTHSLYFGCAECTSCEVDEYEKDLTAAEELDAEAIWFEQMCIEEEKKNRNLFFTGKYEGHVPLNRWSCKIFNDINDYIIKGRDVRVLNVYYWNLGYVDYAIWLVAKHDKYKLEEAYL